MRVEVALKETSTADASELKRLAEAWALSSDRSSDDFRFLREHSRSLTVEAEAEAEEGRVLVHVYRADRSVAGDLSDEEGDGPAAAQRLPLPNERLLGLWDSLVFDDDVKRDALAYAETALHFADRGVDPDVVSFNRLILFHGPPGTGKTSLCRALAQKIAIRTKDRYQGAELVEIHSHGLFSKWFSESGKLVVKLFERINELVEDPDTLVFVLIDEIESLTHSRKAAFSGSEPSDSVRVVNAVLTQLDRIRSYPNVLVLTTSNMTEAIDSAFTDRVDLNRYVGLPSIKAIYEIYSSCVAELMRTQIIEPREDIVDYASVTTDSGRSNEQSVTLLRLAELSKGLNGRTLRKIPLLSHALLHSTNSCTLENFIATMRKTVESYFSAER